MYYKGVLGYESGGTSTVDDFFSREDAQDMGFQQHTGKANGFARSALLCQQADF